MFQDIYDKNVSEPRRTVSPDTETLSEDYLKNAGSQ